MEKRSKSPSSSIEYEDMRMSVVGKWSSRELQQLVWSVDTIHSAYRILEMASNGELHTKTFDLILDQLAKADSLLEQSPLRYLMEPLGPLYRGFNQGPDHVASMMFVRELFDLLTFYIDEKERLSIKKISMGSPGEIVWTGFKKFVSGLQRPMETSQQQSTVSKTSSFIGNIVSTDRNTKLQMVHEYRQVEPRLVDLITRNVFDRPVNIIRKLKESGKIQDKQEQRQVDRFYE